jgi:hypothetical protein
LPLRDCLLTTFRTLSGDDAGEELEKVNKERAESKTLNVYGRISVPILKERSVTSLRKEGTKWLVAGSALTITRSQAKANGARPARR